MIKEDGLWSVNTIKNNKTIYDVCIKSGDSTHDVTLVVTGDFESLPQKQVYAEEIAKRLNSFKEGE